MQLHNVERLLADGEASEDLRGVGVGMVQEEERLAVTARMVVPARPRLAEHGGGAGSVERGSRLLRCRRKLRAELRKAFSSKRSRL